MSSPIKRKRSNLATNHMKTVIENNNNDIKSAERLQARQFISWYRHIIDYDRESLGLYLSDDVVLEWFGRTIKNRKKVSSFLKFDMQCSCHDFKSIESIDKVHSRLNKAPTRNSTKSEILASPLHSPELIRSKSRRPGLRSAAQSPEWDINCKPAEPIINADKNLTDKFRKHPHSDKGDVLSHRVKRKCILVTPPNPEIGQGDGLPSTSGNIVNMPPSILNVQRNVVECVGYIEFTRTRNQRSTESMKWNRNCKVQICYSEDPLNIGEFIIWSIHYSDESKCRRNLLSAFEEVAREEEIRSNDVELI